MQVSEGRSVQTDSDDGVAACVGRAQGSEWLGQARTDSAAALEVGGLADSNKVSVRGHGEVVEAVE